MITIYVIRNELEWETDVYRRLLGELPSNEQKKYASLVRWQDRQSGIVGKLLLKRGIKELGYDVLLEHLRYGASQKPSFEEGPKFNISHSGSYIVCAVSDILDVGIDIEERVPDLNLSDFKSHFTQYEWDEACQAPDPVLWFYDYWTKKEAVLKGDGRGMEIPLCKVFLMENKAWLEGVSWELCSISIHDNYSCYLASMCPTAFSLVHLSVDQLSDSFSV